MELRRLDHVGVIVDDLDAVARLLGALGLQSGEALDRDDLRVAFFRCGEAQVELIEPLDPALRRQRLGEGQRARIEHVAFEVRDLHGTLAELESLGVRPSGPTLSHEGRSMFWTDPATSNGIMFQFVQRPESTGDGA
jgi:methylmalonyl-CoA/ethylmalonyl-CoA epimerase